MEDPFKIKKENKEGRAATPKEAKPDRKLLTLSAMMLGRQIQKALEIERTTPRIRITKPEVRFKDIPIVIEEDDEKEEELIETISIEDEEIEVIVDEEIDTPVESFEIDTEASFTKNAVMQSDEEELPEENEVVEDDMSFLETNNEELLEEEINPEDSASELFSEDRSTRLDSDLLSRLSDDFEDEEEEEEDEN